MGLCQKVGPIRNELVDTGDVGALARIERDARTVRRERLWGLRASCAMRARVPAFPVLARLIPSQATFWAKPIGGLFASNRTAIRVRNEDILRSGESGRIF